MVLLRTLLYTVQDGHPRPQSFFEDILKLLQEKKILEVLCVCVVCCHPIYSGRQVDAPVEVAQEEGHAGFLHLPAVLALLFIARRIQPFLSLVDCEVEFFVLTIRSFST